MRAPPPPLVMASPSFPTRQQTSLSPESPEGDGHPSGCSQGCSEDRPGQRPARARGWAGSGDSRIPRVSCKCTQAFNLHNITCKHLWNRFELWPHCLPPRRGLNLSFFYFNWRLITILWWFLPYIHINQPWVYMCSPS